MQRTLVALGCTLALAAGSAMAQQSGSGENASGSLGDRARQAAQTLGEKAKEAAEKAKTKVEETTDKSKAGTDQSAQSSQGTTAMGSSGTDPQQMQRQADADYKSAKAQCEPIQQPSQKTICEKEATAAHANAEVRIEKAKVAAQGSATTGMGAGKSSR